MEFCLVLALSVFHPLPQFYSRYLSISNLFDRHIPKYLRLAAQLSYLEHGQGASGAVACDSVILLENAEIPRGAVRVCQLPKLLSIPLLYP